MGPSPSNSPWQKLEDESTGVAYYYNSKTGESTYDVPSELEWETHQAHFPAIAFG